MSRRLNGEGTVYQRKDGRWEGAGYVLGPRRTRLRKRVYGATAAEAAAKLRELLAQSQRGIPVASGETMASYLDYWLDHVAVYTVRASTLASYRKCVDSYLTPALGSRRLNRLEARHIRLMLTDLREGVGLARPLSVRTVQHVHAVLRNALQHALREDLVARNVAKQVRVPAPRYDELRTLTAVECRRLLEKAAGDRMYAVFVVMLYTGLRRGEVLALRWDDIDVKGKTLRVRRAVQRVGGELCFDEPKTARAKRTVPLTDAVVTALKGQRARQAVERLAAGDAWANAAGLVFTTSTGKPVEPRNLNRSWYALRQRAGLDGVRLHDLRHTFVSMLLTAGVPPRTVMELAGHSAVNVTMTVYGHVQLDARREAICQLDMALGGTAVTTSRQDSDPKGP